MAFDLERVYRHSSLHREEVLASERCGCFYCHKQFGPREIRLWTDERSGVGLTALCPRCGSDAVLGSASGFPITAELLAEMYWRWFGAGAVLE